MKNRALPFSLYPTFAAVLTLTGCLPPDPAKETDPAGTGVAAPNRSVVFHSGSGLELQAGTARLMGLTEEAAAPRELTERLVTPAVPLPFQDARVTTQWAVLVPPGAVRPGQSLELRRPHQTGPGLNGSVESVDAQLQESWTLVEALVVSPRPTADGPGDWNAVFEIGRREVPVAVPVQAVVRAALGQFVYRIDQGRYVRQRVETGVQDGRWIEIRRGLEAGARIAGAGADKLWLLELSEVGGLRNLDETAGPTKGGDHD